MAEETRDTMVEAPAEAEGTSAVTESAAPTNDGGFGGGYDGGDDVLLPDGWTGKSLYPETEEDPLGLGPEEDSAPEPDAPETPTESAGNAPDTAKGQNAAAPDGTPKTGGDGKTEVDSEPETPDYKALYEAEMDRQNGDKYRQLVRELTQEDGMPLSVAKMTAASECGGKHYPLEEAAPDAGNVESGADSSGPEPGQRRDFAGEMIRLTTLYPDLKEMPAEVMESYGKGMSLTDAYAGYRARTDAAAIASLRQENAALRQRLGNVERAPVQGVSHSGAAQEPEDLFLKGFNSDI